jgi:5'-nucleotidase
MEAVITGRVPGIAVSLDAPEFHSGPLDFSSAARVARNVTSRVLTGTLPEGVLLNVNVPYLEEEHFKGTLVTRQGLRVYLDKLERRIDPRGRPYYWIGGEAPSGVLEEGTDFGSLKAGYVSITPLQLDLTACAALDVIKKWTWK